MTDCVIAVAAVDVDIVHSVLVVGVIVIVVGFVLVVLAVSLFLSLWLMGLDVY